MAQKKGVPERVREQLVVLVCSQAIAFSGKCEERQIILKECISNRIGLSVWCVCLSGGGITGLI